MNKIAQFHKVSLNSSKKAGMIVFQELQKKKSKKSMTRSNCQRERLEDQQDTTFLVRLILN